VGNVIGIVEHAVMHGWAGVAGAVLAMVFCAGHFARRRWPSLLFGMGVACGVVVAQAVTLSGIAGRDDGFTLAVNGVIGGVLGMLVGGLAADWWEARLPRR